MSPEGLAWVVISLELETAGEQTVAGVGLEPGPGVYWSRPGAGVCDEGRGTLHSPSPPVRMSLLTRLPGLVGWVTATV